jgi:hypothetical protein
MPASVLVSVTEALGSNAPMESVTTPERVAVVVAICALIQGVLLTRMANSVAMPPQYNRNPCLLLLLVFNLKPPSGCSPSVQGFKGMTFMTFECLVIGV